MKRPTGDHSASCIDILCHHFYCHCDRRETVEMNSLYSVHSSGCEAFQLMYAVYCFSGSSTHFAFLFHWLNICAFQSNRFIVTFSNRWLFTERKCNYLGVLEIWKWAILNFFLTISHVMRMLRSDTAIHQKPKNIERPIYKTRNSYFTKKAIDTFFLHEITELRTFRTKICLFLKYSRNTFWTVKTVVS